MLRQAASLRIFFYLCPFKFNKMKIFNFSSISSILLATSAMLFFLSGCSKENKGIEIPAEIDYAELTEKNETLHIHTLTPVLQSLGYALQHSHELQ